MPLPPEGAQPWGWQLHAVKLPNRQVLVAMRRHPLYHGVLGLKPGDGKTLLSIFTKAGGQSSDLAGGDSGVMDGPAVRAYV